MQRRELVRAADKLLGPDFKLKPLRKRRVNNPDYKVKSVNWSLTISGEEGQLKISIGKDKVRSISLPVEVYNDDLFGERKVIEITRLFSYMFNKEFMGYVTESIAAILSGEKKGTTYLEGTMLIPPKVLGIPKTVIVEELSLEGLQEDGQLPMDLKDFKKM
jgi:hypothetical protein